MREIDAAACSSHDHADVGRIPGINHRDAAIRALENADFQVVRHGKHVVMSDGTRVLPFRGTTR